MRDKEKCWTRSILSDKHSNILEYFLQHGESIKEEALKQVAWDTSNFQPELRNAIRTEIIRKICLGTNSSYEDVASVLSDVLGMETF